MGNCILVWRPNLEARLSRFQNQLKIPDAERLIPGSKLEKPQTVEIRAVRVYPTTFNSDGHLIGEKEKLSETSLHSYILVTKKGSSEEKKLGTVSARSSKILYFPSPTCWIAKTSEQETWAEIELERQRGSDCQC
jgi:hypothetical protein